MSVLRAKNITKIYGNKQGGLSVKALENFNITIENGEFVGVMGPSGSGKSTLLNILATIDTPTAGELLINDINPMTLSEKDTALFRRRELGFIFQDYNLLDTLSLKENIILPLVLDKVNPNDIERKVADIASLLNIQEVLNKRTYEVSGGQQQRAACARALIHNPSIILADEPTGNLDSKSSQEVMESMKRLNEERGATIMMVSHDPFAASFCHRIIIIKDGKFFLEIVRGSSRQVFFQEILDSLALLGGNYNDIA